MNGTTGRETKHDNGSAHNGADPPPPPPPPSNPNPNPKKDAEDLTTWALRFISTASNETIGGIAVGLAACTYLVLGRAGLILLGGLGGVVLHASWEGQSVVSGNVEGARKEKGIDIIKRILDMRAAQAKSQEEEQGEQDDAVVGMQFEGFGSETAAALNDLVGAVIRDYVKWWYNPILPGERSFPVASRRTLVRFLSSISQHLSKKRPADTFLDFLTNSTSIVIVFLNELASALSTSAGDNASLAESVYTYLSTNPDSNLKTVLNIEQQSKKFRMVAEDILKNFLEKSALECDPARIFLREILAGVVLEMTLKSCSKPEWINGWIVYLLEEGEPDINQAIDAGMSATGLSPDPNINNENPVKATASRSKTHDEGDKGHMRRVSKAEEAMEEAMEEAKRLSQLIADEDAKKFETLNQPEKPATKTSSTTLHENTRSMTAHSPEAPETSPRPSQNSAHSTTPSTGIPFTSFDQIVPQSLPVALQTDSPTAPRRKTVSLTLYNANIIIHDDSTPADKGRFRSKPNGDYLVQIEPESSHQPGWMIVRKYADFETLHEVLRRIAQISGVTSFTEQHSTLPNWKEHSKASLRGGLELYLRDACWYQPLAESEGMKRFLDKDQSQSSNSSAKNAGSGWPAPSAIENKGKGMLDVLTSAPKGAAEGGKAVLGGVTGVFGSLGQKKANGSTSNIGMHTPSRSSTSSVSRMDSINSINGSRKGRASEESLRGTPVIQSQPYKIPPMERRPSYPSLAGHGSEREPRASSSARSSMSGRRSATQSRDSSRAPSRKTTPLSSPITGEGSETRLPPPLSNTVSHHDIDATSLISEPRSMAAALTNGASTNSEPVTQEPPKQPQLQTPKRPPAPLTEEETKVAVELLFAVVNELYTLSSAWNIRRTLLNAAKTFLLRPGNLSLSSIRTLIQDSVIASNTSDAGIASHVRKLRENSLPTEEELKAWPAEMSMEEKEKLRIKARKLLVERGLPAALTGVMGQAATGEAMGRVFDCLQMEEMARGLIFGLLLQGVRAVIH